MFDATVECRLVLVNYLNGQRTAITVAANRQTDTQTPQGSFSPCRHFVPIHIALLIHIIKRCLHLTGQARNMSFITSVFYSSISFTNYTVTHTHTHTHARTRTHTPSNNLSKPRPREYSQLTHCTYQVTVSKFIQHSTYLINQLIN
jgi:hypothetical protein